MQFFDTDTDYIQLADHIRPMYRLGSFSHPELPPFRTIEFTGYKNKKFVDEFIEKDIPLDGSLYMYRIDKLETFDGYDVFMGFLRVACGEEVLTICGYDPRARPSGRWAIITEHQMLQIRAIAHMYGAREYITFSRMISVPLEEDGAVSE